MRMRLSLCNRLLVAGLRCTRYRSPVTKISDNLPNSSDAETEDLRREFQIGHLLRRAYTHAKKHSSAALLEAGLEVGELTPVQASAILALEKKDLSQAELGRWIDMKAANVHSFARRLEAAGIASIQVDPTRSRRSSIALTAEGRRIAVIVRQLAHRSADATLARLDASERDWLAQLLAKLLS
jgi:DNA-binding MarR family transcriptional regulator